MKTNSPAASWPPSETVLLHPPLEPLENWRWRAQLTNLWTAHPEVINNLLSISSKNIVWTFNALFFTKDPRRQPSERPFALYPHESGLLATLDASLATGKDLLVEKSRDMGVSWSVLCWLLWHWRFDESFHAIIGSRLEDLIDEKGNLDTHFERLRWLCRSLPAWWLPHRFDPDSHIQLVPFSERAHIPYMRLMRPDSDNTMVGEAVTEDFSRQGRYRVAFLDEFAACEQAEGAWTATADSAPMRLAVSTPKGLGNKFAQLRRSGTIEVLSLHWSQHPEKARGLYCETHGKPAPATCAWPICRLRSPWYDAECSRREATEVAQELDIDYLGSGHPYFDLMAVERQQPEEPWAVGSLVEVDLGVEFRAHEGGAWSIWELPPPKPPLSAIPLIRCVIGADVAEGIGEDYSVGVVRDGVNRGLKAALRTHMDTDQFAHELMKAGRFYHQAVILCERNGPGFAVNADLVRSYGNVWHERAVQQDGMPITKRYGWPTNARTKELMLTQMREEVRSGAAALRDKRLIEECKTFVVNDDGKVGAAAGYHDDMIVAFSIAGMGIQLLHTTKPAKRPRPMPDLQPSNLAG